MIGSDVVRVIAALAGLAGDVIEASAAKGEDPVDAIEALRVSLRASIEASAQAELDAKFGK
jgi:hypothetical protein